MHQKLSHTLHFLATSSFYFFLIFIPQSFFLIVISSVIKEIFGCMHPACYEGWLLPTVTFTVATTLFLAHKHGSPFDENASTEPGQLQTNDLSPKIVMQIFSQRTCLQLILAVPLLLFGGCCILFLTIVAWDDMWGTLVERAIHYPNSQLVHVEYGVYGSTDSGAKIHLRWTSDTVEQVASHYDRFLLYREHVHIIDSNDEALEFTACAWAIAFNPTFFEESKTHPCDLVKHLLDERGGTLIEFSHSYFAG